MVHLGHGPCLDSVYSVQLGTFPRILGSFRAEGNGPGSGGRRYCRNVYDIRPHHRVHNPGGSDYPFGQVVLPRPRDAHPILGAFHLLECSVSLSLWPSHVDVFRLPTPSWRRSSISRKPRQCVKRGSRILPGQVAGFSRGSGRGFCLNFVWKSRAERGFSATVMDRVRLAVRPPSQPFPQRRPLTAASALRDSGA